MSTFIISHIQFRFLNKPYTLGINSTTSMSNTQIKEMKTDRSWKWLLGLGLATLVSAGVMAQGGDDSHQKRHDGGRGGKHHYENSGKRNLSDKVYRITEADSVQKQKMKPTLDRASKRLEALKVSYRKQEKKVLDSLSVQLKPYLKEEQLKRLNDWKDKTGK